MGAAVAIVHPNPVDGSDLILRVSEALQDEDSAAVRATIAELIEAEAWRYSRDGGRDFRFSADEFARFIAAPVDAGGLETTVEMIRHHLLVDADIATMQAFDRLTGRAEEKPTTRIIPIADVCKLEVHPAADLVPRMTDEEFQSLKESIATNGLIHPIIVHDGKILDGRHRREACRQLDRDPPVEDIECDDPAKYVFGANLARRHLNQSQRALIAAGLAEMYKVDGIARRQANLKQSQAADVLDLAHRDEGRSRDRAAEVLGISPALVQKATTVLNDGVAELADSVRAGDTKIEAAFEVAKLPAEEQKATVAKGSGEIRKKAKEQRDNRKVAKVRIMRESGNEEAINAVLDSRMSIDEAYATIDQKAEPDAAPKPTPIEVGPKTILNLGTGPACPPLPGHVRPMTFWNAEVARLDALVEHVEKAGGIEGATEGMSRAELTYLRNHLVRFLDHIDRWSAELENRAAE